MTRKQLGGRIATKKTTAKELVELGRHPDSRESFEPMQGVTLLCVAPLEDPEAVEVFLLAQPFVYLRTFGITPFVWPHVPI